jgi:hypothetical protein
MKIAIHQPEFLPWFGYIHKLANVDKFVLLDDVQFKKNNFQNRNRIITKQGLVWLTVPIKNTGINKKIRETLIDNTKNYKKKLILTIEQNYKKFPFFQDLSGLIEILNKDYETIFELNFKIIKYIIKNLDISTEIILQSDLNTQFSKTELLLEICQKVGAKQYLMSFSGGGMEYFNFDLFKKYGINVVEHKFEIIKYNQKYRDEFFQYVSFIDIVANIGWEGLKNGL